ncbi:DGQHR domain-containing protein [Pedobacter sp. AW1-32]|uniref:DGQHR domain-containing protein n=1 Tax=Pedobacter sp. AW1-32 TaxID=3383026 RepID=UPI003FF0763E
MENMGFKRAPGIDDTQFVYDGRTSELDDIFFQENIIVITEYTVERKVSVHLTGKKIIYDLINADTAAFMKFLLTHDSFKAFQKSFKASEADKYSLKQLQVKIIYASKYQIPTEHKELVEKVTYFDFPIVKYFESIAKIIKRTAKYEFFDFLEIPFSKVGAVILKTATGSADDFQGHILPEEHSSFQDGYKIVTFYIDAESLLKRAFVLRKDGWRNSNNVGLYQRMLLAPKMKDLRKYLQDEERVFINNIIVTIPIEKVKLFDDAGIEIQFDDDGNIKNSEETKIQPTKISIDSVSNIIGIIDGQHRSYAYHEGDDTYEKSIAKLRGKQNLLVTGILYPKNEIEDKRLKFEAKLFLEINAKQAGADVNVKQEIESLLNPFSTISISKYVINKLNMGGPLGTLFTQYWYERTKIKTASIISFGLRPLLKLDGTDSTYKLWTNPNKHELKTKNENFELLQEYKVFAVNEIRNLLIAFKDLISPEKWSIDKNEPAAMLNVTVINGIINLLRILIENGKTGDVAYYKSKIIGVDSFDFKSYKSSQYRQMGQALFDQFFK